MQFGRWTVIEDHPNVIYGKTPLPVWKCRCSCGTERVVVASRLKKGTSQSCGCLARELARKRFTTHGESGRNGGTPRYELWRGAKLRARKNNIAFDLEVEDIHIPERCPILGCVLEPHTGGKPKPNSPSLDRTDPTLGYIRGNVEVISYRANVLKGDASLEELKALARFM